MSVVPIMTHQFSPDVYILGQKMVIFIFSNSLVKCLPKKSRKSGFFDTLHESVKMNTDFTLKYFESKVTLSHLVVHRVLQGTCGSILNLVIYNYILVFHKESFWHIYVYYIAMYWIYELYA